MKPISRASGRSAVAASAYRAGQCLTNERDGLTHDFTRRDGVEHSEIVIPRGSGAEWALDRSALWNAAELAEKRVDARVAREFEIALPHELTAEQRLELCREFAQELADRYGAAVDFAIHAPQRASDIRNHHAHLMMTTRKAMAEGLGDKTDIERENKWLAAHDQPSSQVQLRDIRQSWEQMANAHLARAGLEIRIDHRSHQERGLEIEPSEHMGVHATQMERRGQAVSRAKLDSETARHNAELIREKPEQVLSIITGEKSVFDQRDVARALHRAIDGAEAFQSAFVKVMASPALVELQAERRGPDGRVLEAARYSTREMVEIERGMILSAARMGEALEHGVAKNHVEAALSARAFLSDEQREAVRHVAGAEQIAIVIGLAGAGKSTMLSAAREAWERAGYHVFGAALSGKAAEGLEASSGIASRTLASWENGWSAGRGELGKGDVLVIDEAGMVSSKQLATFIGAAERAGAKIVLVGDPEQLQPIQAGAAFRAVAEHIGYASLEGIRRQEQEWQRQASQDFARHRTQDGLAAYAERGAVRFAETRDDAIESIVRDVGRDMRERPDGSRLVLAHRRADVRELNEAIREARQQAGELARGDEADERSFQTNDGVRTFAWGDRIIFLENNRDLGVKNGMLGEVTSVAEGRLSARLDGAAGPGRGREVSVSLTDYAAIDHGYATTIHKSQGATVDRAYVLASEGMDRHLSYVAMTRHREEATLYAGRDQFADLRELSARLSRSGAKETTLDYARDYGERRGIAERLGVSSEIEVSEKGPSLSTPGRAGALARTREIDRQLQSIEEKLAVLSRDPAAVRRRVQRLRMEAAVRPVLPALAQLIEENREAMAEAVAGLGERMAENTATAIVAAMTKRPQAPLVAAIPASADHDSFGRGATKDAIRAAVDADEGVRAARGQVLSALRQTYRDPSAAARRLRELEQAMGGAEALRPVLERRGELERLGELLGEKGRWWRRAGLDAEVARARAERSGLGIGAALVEQRRRERTALAQYVAVVEAQRRRDLIEIPGLSMPARATIDRLRQAGCEVNVSSSIGWLAVDEIPLAAEASAIWSAAGPEARGELERFAAAVDARFPEAGAPPGAPAASAEAMAARRLVRNAVKLNDVHQAREAHERKMAARNRWAFPEPAPDPDPPPRPRSAPSPGF